MSIKTRHKFGTNARHVFLILFPFFFVFCTQWLSSLTPGKTMPGDNGDSRFNLIILEYVHRSIFVNQSNVFDLPFYFPFQSVGGFSDLHIGSIFGYALPRLLGFGMFASMQEWVAIGCLQPNHEFRLPVLISRNTKKRFHQISQIHLLQCPK